VAQVEFALEQCEGQRLVDELVLTPSLAQPVEEATLLVKKPGVLVVEADEHPTARPILGEVPAVLHGKHVARLNIIDGLGQHLVAAELLPIAVEREVNVVLALLSHRHEQLHQREVSLAQPAAARS